VTDVKHLDPPLFLQNTIDDSIEMGPVAVEKGCFFSGVAGQRYGSVSRLRMASFNPVYHLNAAAEFRASISS
jgi:hypothetical protein